MEAVLRNQISEAPRATDDGRIWPVARHRMVDPFHIRSRMRADIEQMMREGGEDAVITVQNLYLRGWSTTQVELHAKAAFDLANARQDAKHQAADAAQAVRSRDSAGRFMAEAAALALFCLPVILLAGHFSGAL